MTEARDGKQYRCIVTDSKGTTWYSNPAEIIYHHIHITKQPENFYGDINEPATFTVEGKGSGLSYQWQVSTDGGSSWNNSTSPGNNSKTMTVPVSQTRLSYRYRCKLTDSSNRVGYSGVVRMYLSEIKITDQPKDIYIVAGQSKDITLTAEGSSLTYQWQVSTNGGKNWTNSTSPGYNTDTLTVTGAEYRFGYLYRCKLTDVNGTTRTSQTARMCLKATDWEFTYDANGLRTQRTNGTDTYKYVYSGGQLIHMSVAGKNLYFSYSPEGVPFAMVYSGVNYLYATNLQGDVTAILDIAGNPVVEYTYDAWGNILTISGSMATTLGTHNPLRYRGYVYDWETGLYYLQSRYYDPELGRFINGDALVSTGQGFAGNNMFVYCLNSPVSRIEILGYISEDAAKKIIKDNIASIIEAGQEFSVDPVTIAGCIYSEQVLNVDWKDYFFDYPCYFLDTSIGVGQVKVSTAIILEDLGYIEKTEPVSNLTNMVSRKQLIAGKLLNDKANIRYVAAYLSAWQDVWESTIDISDKPEILGTLYNLGTRARKPNKNPSPNAFGSYLKTKYDMLYKLIG